ncbi:MAG: phosphonate metabolism protein/1,5-bisphosphokinase (PRPP-forming) PhnN [Methylobacteriaceae bacterium]|nr:phosphonate metabolism protein/1,5-bisphosphokinase (PRPP-forming) PhnN [Methylobacteriaceae bacterium]
MTRPSVPVSATRPDAPPAPGTLFLVVGPSGSGKDTLLDGAKAALAPSRRFVFARRVVTRPADAGGEAHEAVSEAEFAARDAAGGFLIAWAAHGLRYGLPAALGEELAAGRHVVANGSRAAAPALARRVTRLLLVEVWAPPAILAARLAGRGREDAAAIEARLARGGLDLPPGLPAIRVVNDAAPETGVARFVAALREAAGLAQP